MPAGCVCAGFGAGLAAAVLLPLTGAPFGRRLSDLVMVVEYVAPIVGSFLEDESLSLPLEDRERSKLFAISQKEP